MNRRTLLRRLRSLLSLSIAAGVAGCSDGNDPPASPTYRDTNTLPPSPTPYTGTVTTDTPLATAIIAQRYSFELNDAGYLEVTVPLLNRDDQQRTASVTVIVETGDDRYERTQTVTLDAGEETELLFEFEAVTTRSVSTEVIVGSQDSDET